MGEGVRCLPQVPKDLGWILEFNPCPDLAVRVPNLEPLDAMLLSPQALPGWEAQPGPFGGNISVPLLLTVVETLMRVQWGRQAL